MSSRGMVVDADAVHDELVSTVGWEQGHVFRYERWIDEPRLGAYQSGWPAATRRWPTSSAWIVSRYKVQFGGVALAPLSRRARRCFTFHRDRELRWLDDTVIGVLTLGARRPWLMKPLTGRRTDAGDDDHLADAIDLSPASGDLMVMGGGCQAAWLHTVPKVRHRVRSRVSAQWRWTSKSAATTRTPTRPTTRPATSAVDPASRPAAQGTGPSGPA